MWKPFWSSGLTNDSLMLLHQEDWVLIPSENMQNIGENIYKRFSAWSKKYRQKLISQDGPNDAVKRESS